MLICDSILNSHIQALRQSGYRQGEQKDPTVAVLLKTTGNINLFSYKQ